MFNDLGKLPFNFIFKHGQNYGTATQISFSRVFAVQISIITLWLVAVCNCLPGLLAYSLFI